MAIPIREFNLSYIEKLLWMIKLPDVPYPIYTTNEYDSFIHDFSDFKGIFIVDSQRYYSGELIKRYSDQLENIGFFITYEYGKIDYIRRPTMNFNIVFNFDYNPDLDHYGTLTIKLIDWFVEKHKEEIPYIDVDGCRIVGLFEYISNPIYRIEAGVTSFVRRAVVFNFKTIIC